MKVFKIEEYEKGYIHTYETGCVKNGYCAITDDKTKYGKLITSISGESECEKYLFLQDWDSENEINKRYLLAIIPELKQRIDSENFKNLSIPNLYKIAKKRMYIKGYTKTCPRCGGSGNYSYNQKDGTICYGCMGKKIVPLTITKSLIDKIGKEFLK